MKRKNSLVLKVIKYTEIAVIAVSLSAFASSDSSKANSQIKESKTEYKLSVYDGRIAVFENSDEKPAEVFDVYISSLPYSEQIELLNGMTVYNKNDLQQLIEDYTS